MWCLPQRPAVRILGYAAVGDQHSTAIIFLMVFQIQDTQNRDNGTIHALA